MGEDDYHFVATNASHMIHMELLRPQLEIQEKQMWKETLIESLFYDDIHGIVYITLTKYSHYLCKNNPTPVKETCVYLGPRNNA